MLKTPITLVLALSIAGLARAQSSGPAMSGPDLLDPAYVAGVEPSAHFPDKQTAWLKEGRFVSPRNIRQVAPGMTKPQLYQLLGEPHFYTPFPFVRIWNYIFDFHTGHGADFVQCQYQIKFGGSPVAVEAAFWKDAVCASYIVDAPPPPPPPPPPPLPAARMEAPTPPAPQARSFVVYFPFDRAEITAEAADVLKSVAGYDQSQPGAHAMVVGFTDTSGSIDYNEALSERRAKAVVAALIGDGLAPAGLGAAWKGKTDLAVPTADGVKEPLNRRATIRIEPGG